MKGEPYGLGRQTLPANIARPIAKVAKLYVSRPPSQYQHICPINVITVFLLPVLPNLHGQSFVYGSTLKSWPYMDYFIYYLYYFNQSLSSALSIYN